MKTILFYADSGDDAKDFSTLVTPTGSKSLHKLIEQHLDPTNGPAPKSGYRLSETSPDGTHCRQSPWIVYRKESYVPDIPIGTKYIEVVICWCDWQPLSDEENPWIEIARNSDLSNLPRQVLLDMGLSEEQIDSGVLEQFKL